LDWIISNDTGIGALCSLLTRQYSDEVNGDKNRNPKLNLEISRPKFPASMNAKVMEISKYTQP
jgi:hypothetical protein